MPEPEPDRSTPDAGNEASADAGPGPGRRVDRRRLDEIFGDVLPSVTQDELTDETDRSAEADRERWYRDNTPPHHG